VGAAPPVEDQVPLPSIARHAGVPIRTMQRWLTSYRADGLAGLARHPAVTEVAECSHPSWSR